MSEYQIPRDDFVAVNRSPPRLLHEVIIAVKKSRLEDLEALLIERATPGNDMYQQWLTMDEVDEVLADTKVSAQAVLKWCHDQPDLVVHSITRRYDFIRVLSTIERWETLLQTQFYEYEDHSYLDLVENEIESSLFETTFNHMFNQEGADTPRKTLFSTTTTSQEIQDNKKKRNILKRKRNKRSPPVLHRAEQYTIPNALQSHVEGILNTVQTPPRYQPKHHGLQFKEKELLLALQQQRKHHFAETFKSSASSSSSSFQNHLRDAEMSSNIEIRRLGSSSPSTVTIPFINELYEVSSNMGDSTIKQSIFSTGKEYYSTSDLIAFQQYFDLLKQPAIAKSGHAIPSCPADGTNDTVHCLEGNLDMQYIMGTAQNTSTVFWWIPFHPSIDPFAAWSVLVANETHPPTSHAISWGTIEILESELIMRLFNTEAMILSAMGVTIIVAAGDDGAPNCLKVGTVSGITSDTCLCDFDSSSSQLAWKSILPEPFSGAGYFPNFPASSPYVTTVGATMGPEVGGSHEVAAQSQAGGLITSGGGFSMYFQTPGWQRTVVDDYLTYFPHIQPGYNPNGRGYPDISLIGVDYAVMVDGEWSAIFGTSCVAPVLAGWISLINALRQQSGLNTTVGWMNPTLYNVGHNQSKQLPNAYRAAFRDVTSGHNRCCHSSSKSNLKPTCCASGFVATCGWDPVTGWGSIAFPSLLAMFGPQNITADFYESSNYLNTSTYYPPFCVETIESPRRYGLSSITAIIIVTTSVLLLVLLFAVLVGYVVFVCRARQLSFQRVLSYEDSGGGLDPYSSVPVASATIVGTSHPSALIVTTDHVQSTCTEASSPSCRRYGGVAARAMHISDDGMELITVTATEVPEPILVANPHRYLVY